VYRAAGALIQFHIAPFVAIDSVANLRCIFAFLMQLTNKENLLETDLSGGTVIVYMTMQEAFVPKPSVAITVTGLLRQHLRDVFRQLVGFAY
jgi:hypothetical protein